nr:hypothetical protein [Tanacetum cinerariifolium]
MAANQTIKNNSIRSILDKEKLNGSNFFDWYRNLRIVLRNEQNLHHLEEALSEAPPAIATADVRNAYTRRVTDQQEVACLMLQVGQELFETVKAFHACIQEKRQSVSTYTITELHAMLKLAEKGIPKKTLAVLAIRQGQIQKPKSQAQGKGKQRGNGKKLKKNKANTSGTSGIFTIELLNFPKSNTWIYDTGCGTHIYNTIQGLKGYWKLNKGYLDMYVGNGHSAAVEAIGSFELILPSGMILDKGFPHEFMDNGAILVSKDNMFYFNAFLSDGSFEIDMHNHISNERSIYTCSNKKTKHNLDSTFLWHCRLVHINKKRIEKLQHVGLLKSVDDESFDVCVSCISGKMARKPFTHASKRADDLLGIIHSEVCGPFRTTSREGANYYVTFTDDFSRHGYVYLIKHKHKVSEMFKTFQNEVENQLSKTIIALRSDQGGEYLSQEFLDHLNSCGIISQLTPPYTPQHNGVSERKNQTLLDMVPFMTSLTTLPMSFGGYDLEFIARILNMVPTKKVNKTPYEMWHVKVSNLSYLEIWGSMNAKMQSMKDNQVWNLVDLPPNCKTVSSKWLFKKKTDMDGNIHTYKDHLVAKGFTQTYRVDYEETFLPVADIKAIRILIAIEAYYDYEIWQMDVKTTFLNGRLNEDIYMNKRFDEEIKKYGFSQNPDESCVYKRASGSIITFLILYVDDILLMGNNIPMLQDVKSWLGKCFPMKDLDTSKHRTIPMQPNVDLSKSQGPSTPTEVKRMKEIPYALAVGSIMYVVRCTRPNVAFSHNLISRYQQNPSKSYWTAVKNIPKYLRNTKDMFLVYGGDSTTKLGVTCYTDASWEMIRTTFDLKRAKYIATAEAAMEAIWICKFISGLGGVPNIDKPMDMYCDSTCAITITDEPGVQKGAKHFRRKYHFIREVIQEGDIRILKVHTDNNLADPLTKPMHCSKHVEHARSIGLRRAAKGPGFVLGKGSWDREEMGEWWNGAGNTGERGCGEWRENWGLEQ